ncbi:hypothetical protein [Acetobacter papayae]|uniref:hypothetical protein n=1 Tax=Acetobacter papayae TaxID=1076592 RepID=UPI0039E918E3
MTSLSFPEWMPLWGQLLMLAGGILFGLAFMMMPFAVFGVKGRLAELSLQVGELQAQLRAQSLREPVVQATPAPPRDDTDRVASPAGVIVEEVPAAFVYEGRQDNTPPAQTGAHSNSMRDVPPKDVPLREPPVLVALQTPRVSDAYQPRQSAPPAPTPVAPPRQEGWRGQRMPWHEAERAQADSAPETAAQIMRRQHAPDANQPAWRPDFSQETARYSDMRSKGADNVGMTPLYPLREDDRPERSEPVLNWPVRERRDHHDG